MIYVFFSDNAILTLIQFFYHQKIFLKNVSLQIYLLRQKYICKIKHTNNVFILIMMSISRLFYKQYNYV